MTEVRNELDRVLRFEVRARPASGEEMAAAIGRALDRDLALASARFGMRDVAAGWIRMLMTIGTSLAITISYATHKSIGWAILHGICGWLYVLARA